VRGLHALAGCSARAARPLALCLIAPAPQASGWLARLSQGTAGHSGGLAQLAYRHQGRRFGTPQTLVRCRAVLRHFLSTANSDNLPS
jgi:hypothetical protein